MRRLLRPHRWRPLPEPDQERVAAPGRVPSAAEVLADAEMALKFKGHIHVASPAKRLADPSRGS